MKNYTRNCCVSLLLVLSALGLFQPAHGQTSTEAGPASTTDRQGPIVGNVETLGPNEISLGNAIEEVCPRLVGRIGTERGAGEVDLQRRCTEVVVASVNGSVSDPGINNILRELNVDEAAAQNRGLVELAAVSTVAVIGRLEQLRLADARGLEGLDEVIVQRSGPDALSYHFETGGAAGDSDFSRWGVYLNGELFSGDRDPTVLEAGFDLDGGRLTVGADYRVNDNTFVGAALDYVSSSADFDNDSELDSDGVNITAYGTTYTGNGLYLEGSIGFGSNDYEQDRRFQYTIPAVPPPAGIGGGPTVVNQTASSETDGDQFFVSAGVGKDINAGNGITANLSGTLAYLDASIDGFTETVAGTGPGSGMGLTVQDQDIESLRSVVGAQVSKAISTKNGVLLPFARLDWIHEFENDSRTIVASFVNDVFPTKTTFALTTEEPDEDYFRLGGGLSAVFVGGLQGFVSLEGVLGLSDLSYYSVTAGLRKEL